MTHIQTHTEYFGLAVSVSVCVVCGVLMHKSPGKGRRRKYCQSCAVEVVRKGASGDAKLARLKIKGSDSPCVRCGSPVRFGKHGFCSHKCSSAYRVEQAGTALNLIPSHCGQCGSPYKRTHKAQRYCSGSCSSRAAREKLTRYHACVNCGVIFKHKQSAGANKFCTRACFFDYVRKQKSIATSQNNTKRRAKEFGCEVTPYKRDEVFDRDGWVCHICGDPVSRDVEWPNPMSASVDHVIPLSRGGGDTPGNVKLAHLGCNMEKSDGTPQVN